MKKILGPPKGRNDFFYSNVVERSLNLLVFIQKVQIQLSTTTIQEGCSGNSGNFQ